MLLLYTVEEWVLTSSVCIPSFASLNERGCTSEMVSDTTYKTETRVYAYTLGSQFVLIMRKLFYCHFA